MQKHVVGENQGTEAALLFLVICVDVGRHVSWGKNNEKVSKLNGITCHVDVISIHQSKMRRTERETSVCLAIRTKTRHIHIRALALGYISSQRWHLTASFISFLSESLSACESLSFRAPCFR